jgi:hypothetical protein
MDGGHSQRRPTAAEGPGDEDQRETPDRRSGRERRGSGEHTEPTPDPRPYGFREFNERRCKQDRRLYGFVGAWSRTPQDPAVETTAAGPPPAAEGSDIVPLTDSELKALLARSDH